MSNFVYPSVLIVAGYQHHGKGQSPSEIYSGSGFILDARNGIVATSATWLSGLLSIETAEGPASGEFRAAQSREAIPGNHRHAVAMQPNSLSEISTEFGSVRWESKSRESVQLQVLLQSQEEVSTHHRTTDMFVSKSAQILGIYPMGAVSNTLAKCLSSLSHWRCSAGQVQSGSTEAAVVKTSNLESILLPLSCVVLVQLEDIQNLRYREALSNPPDALLALFPASCGVGVCPTQESGIETNAGLPHIEFTRQKLQLGDSVCITGTPFGSFCPEVFFGAQSVGCVSKLLGDNGAVFLTDARCLPGCEGAMVVRRNSAVSSSLTMVGMVLSPLLTTTGSASGLGLACSVNAIIHTLQRHLLPFAMQRDFCSRAVEPKAYPFNRVLPLVVAVEAGNVWGSGILLTPRTVLTCGHVVQGTTKGPIAIWPSGSTGQFEAQVLFSRKIPDIAVLQLKIPISTSEVLRAVTSAFGSIKGQTLCDKMEKEDSQLTTSDACEGSFVFIIGHGFEDPAGYTGARTPTVTGGVLSKVVKWEGKPVMLMTTAVVHSGMSGGLLVCASTGSPLGMVVSNSLDVEAGSVYPDVSYCLPFSWILSAPFLEFGSRGDVCLEELPPRCSDDIASIWKLKSKFTPDQMLQSKL